MAIWRGTGGSGESTSDSSILITTQNAAEAAASAAAALASKNAAETAETNAETAETNAETAATAAASSASTASTKASEASTSANNAASSATAAATSATNAANSASSAASSASSASTSASTATTKASEASTSATNAASSATSAATSATNAASSASSASGSANTATTQASNASTSASSASTSAIAAANSATAAATSATSAASSATSAASSATVATTAETNALSSSINAANSATTAASFTPSQTGNSGKFLTTNGTSTSWASINAYNTLDSLADVAISSVTDGDILRYNSIASEWQNINLGISAPPTISVSGGTLYTNLLITFTITNHASYADPAYFFQLKLGGTVIVDNDSFIRNGATISFAAPASSGTYTLESKTQDFGQIASQITSTSISIVTLPALRYFRVRYIGSTSYNFLINFRLYTGSNRTGTSYPSNMTSNSLPSPYVASSSGAYSATYEAWKVFDSDNVSGWWNLGLSGTYSTAYVQIDLGSAINIVSGTITNNLTYINYGTIQVVGSATGAFAGEEITFLSTTDRSSIINF